jgi:hypothetical protein
MENVILVLFAIFVLFWVFRSVAAGTRSAALLYIFVILMVTEFGKRFIYLGNPDVVVYYYLLLLSDLAIAGVFIAGEKSSYFWNYLGVIVYFVLVSIVLGNQSLGSTIISVRSWFLVPALFFIRLRESKERNLSALRVFYVWIMFSVVYSAWQFFMDYPVWEYRWDQKSPAQMNLDAITMSGTLRRSFSFFSEVANQGIAYGIALFFLPSIARQDLFRFLLSACLLFGLMITGSRTAILAIAVAYLVEMLFRRRVTMALFVVAFGPAALLSFLHPSILYPLVELAQQIPNTAVSGFANVATVFSRFGLMNNIEWKVTNVVFGTGVGYDSGIVFDNLYIYWFYKTGLVGMALLFWVIFRIGQFLKAVPTETTRRSLVLSSVFILVFSNASLAVLTRSTSALVVFVVTFALEHNRSSHRDLVASGSATVANLIRG